MNLNRSQNQLCTKGIADLNIYARIDKKVRDLFMMLIPLEKHQEERGIQDDDGGTPERKEEK